jgi:hypothetical protein
MYREFYKDSHQRILQPLEDGLELLRPFPEDKLPAVTETESDGQGRSHSPSTLVRTVIDTCIQDEDSPRAAAFEPAFPSYHPDVVDFAPAFYSENYLMLQEDREILTNAYEMAKDQMGCRVLQRKLEATTEFVLGSVFSQTLLHFPELMVHPFGNYLCQKMIEICSEAQVKMIMDLIAPQLLELSLDPHGTRVVQKVIEVFGQNPCISVVITALRPHTSRLVTDLNGNHVVQRFLHACTPSLNQFIFDAICTTIIDVATNRHGCCVLQRCVDSASEFQREALVSCIVDNAVTLVQDAYGNYAVQYVLDLNIPAVNARLGRIFTQQIVALSEQKFSSNVIEKCLQQNQPDVQEEMIKEIAKPRNLSEMITDQYANYVVQRALTLAPPRLEKDLLAVISIQCIRGNLEQLKRSQYGKRVYSKLVKKYPELGDGRYYA